MNHSNCERCRKPNCVSSTHELKGNQMTIIETCSQCHGITTTKYTVEIIFKQTVYEEPVKNIVGTIPSEEVLANLRPGISEDHFVPNEHQ